MRLIKRDFKGLIKGIIHTGRQLIMIERRYCAWWAVGAGEAVA